MVYRLEFVYRAGSADSTQDLLIVTTPVHMFTMTTIKSKRWYTLMTACYVFYMKLFFLCANHIFEADFVFPSFFLEARSISRRQHTVYRLESLTEEEGLEGRTRYSTSGTTKTLVFTW